MLGKWKLNPVFFPSLFHGVVVSISFSQFMLLEDERALVPDSIRFRRPHALLMTHDGSQGGSFQRSSDSPRVHGVRCQSS